MSIPHSSSHARHSDLIHWINSHLVIDEIIPLPADASFRKYFRVVLTNGGTRIVMDAPPDKEDCRPFVYVAKLLAQQGLHVPEIFAADIERGFLILSDFGNDLYGSLLTADNVATLYIQAITDLLKIQHCSKTQAEQLPEFAEAALREELQRFRHWYLLEYLQMQLTADDEKVLADAFESLIVSAIMQPQVCVHRDYHSRNLLQLPDNKVGILDFQDAVWGPITYDLVSLLRDCYVSWPQQQVIDWALHYYHAATQQNLLAVTEAQFLRWFDLMGVQRHLKAIYIFARKFKRDYNPTYLGDIPRTLQYIVTVTEKYSELHPLRDFLLRLPTDGRPL